MTERALQSRASFSEIGEAIFGLSFAENQFLGGSLSARWRSPTQGSEASLGVKKK